MVRRTGSQRPGGISHGPRIMDLANLGEVSVLKVPIRPGRTEALVTWFKQAAAKEDLWDLLSEQDVILRVFVERGDECDYLYSVKQGPDLTGDQIDVPACTRKGNGGWRWLRLSAHLCNSMSDYERLAGAL